MSAFLLSKHLGGEWTGCTESIGQCVIYWQLKSQSSNPRVWLILHLGGGEVPFNFSLKYFLVSMYVSCASFENTFLGVFQFQCYRVSFEPPSMLQSVILTFVANIYKYNQSGNIVELTCEF